MGSLTIDFKFSLSGQESLHFIKCSQFVVKYSFLFFKIDCWFTVEWWENKAVPAESWREAFICFIDLVHYCEMFSMCFSFGYKMYSQTVLAAELLQCPGESLLKEGLEFGNDSFVGEAFCRGKFCPLHIDRCHCNLVLFSDRGWLSPLTAWAWMK